MNSFTMLLVTCAVAGIVVVDAEARALGAKSFGCTAKQGDKNYVLVCGDDPDKCQPENHCCSQTLDGADFGGITAFPKETVFCDYSTMQTIAALTNQGFTDIKCTCDGETTNDPSFTDVCEDGSQHRDCGCCLVQGMQCENDEACKNDMRALKKDRHREPATDLAKAYVACHCSRCVVPTEAIAMCDGEDGDGKGMGRACNDGSDGSDCTCCGAEERACEEDQTCKDDMNNVKNGGGTATTDKGKAVVACSCSKCEVPDEAKAICDANNAATTIKVGLAATILAACVVSKNV